MMKRLLIILLILLFSGSSFAGPGAIKAVIAAKRGAGGSLGGEVGNKSGATDDTATPPSYPGNDQGLSGCFAASQSGDISYIHVYQEYSSGTTGQQYNAAIYTSDGTTLLRDGSLSNEGGTIPGRTSIALDSSYTISQGTTYCLSFGAHNSPDSWNIGATTASGINIYIDTTYTVGASMPASVDVTTVRNSNESLRIWATNTSDGS